MYFNNEPDYKNLITFISGKTQITIEPRVIKQIVLIAETVCLITPEGKYEITMYNNSSAAKHMAQWMKNAYDIPLITIP